MSREQNHVMRLLVRALEDHDRPAAVRLLQEMINDLRDRKSVPDWDWADVEFVIGSLQDLLRKSQG